MAKKKAKSVATPATQALDALGIAYELRQYEHDPRVTDFGQECAEQLGVDEARVLKTLVVKVDGEFAVAVLPVSHQASLKSIAQALGGKRGELAAPADAERRSGYVVGGVSPLGHRQKMAVVLDESALTWPSVFVSAGRRGADLEMEPAALAQATDALVADIRAVA